MRIGGPLGHSAVRNWWAKGDIGVSRSGERPSTQSYTVDSRKPVLHAWHLSHVVIML